ncbi:hypothetical protein J2Z23_003197 [Lederbergia galactosidilyticus]|nr:hypothetical protein [Lederbergia galactosidilytica]
MSMSTAEKLAQCQHIIDVTQFGADPTGHYDSTTSIWQALEFAKKMSGQIMIDFPKGTYQLQKATAQARVFHTSNTDSIQFPEKQIALLLEDQQDIILNGNDSLFIVHGDCMALAVIRSKNVHLYNFSWDYAIPTVIEMCVTAIGEIDGEQYTDFSIPDCFPFNVGEDGKKVHWYSERNPETGEYYWTYENHTNAPTIVAYHPDRNISRRYDLGLGPFSDRRTKITRLSDREIRVFYGKRRPALHQKDLLFEFCSIPMRQTAGALIWESSDTVIEKITPHYLHGFGWLTQMSHNITYRDCAFRARGGSGRQTTSFADLIHVSGASGHIHIEGCEFYHPHDDPINIHGTFTRVEEKVDEHTMKLRYVHRQQGGFPQFYPGNEVAFYYRDTLGAVDGEEKRYIVKTVQDPGVAGNDLRTMTVTFEQSLPAELFRLDDGEPLVVAENTTYTPSVHIENNHFETVPTRGILCTTGKKVLIENNTFRHMAMDAIFISNDSQDWYESGPVRDVTIQSNTFYVAKVGNPGWRTAGIRVHPVTKGSQYPAPEQAIHQNIKIKHNKFYMEHESVLSIGSVNNLLFKNNMIERYQPELNASYYPTLMRKEERTYPTFEWNACKNVQVENNRFGEGIERTELVMNMSNIKTPK